MQGSDGRWLVTYTYSAAASRGVGAGLSVTALEAGGDKAIGGMSGVSASGSSAQLGASLGGSAGVQVAGRESFDTEEEAWRFHRMPIPSADLLPPTQASAASGLRPGEKRSVQVSLKGSAGLSGGGTAAPGVGVGAAGGLTATLEIARVEGSWVEVTITGAAQAGVSASIGAPMLDVGGQTDVGERVSGTWRLDLETPGGAKAYEGLLLGQVPEPGPGVEPPSQTVAATGGSHANVGLPGVTFQMGSQRVDETLSRGDGTRRETELGAESQKVSWWRLVQGLLRDVDADLGAAAFTEYDGSGQELDSQVLLTARTGSNDASSNYEALGRAHGRSDSTRPGLGASTPGTWELAVVFGPGSLDRLKQKACSDHWGEPHVLRHLSGEQRRFIEALRAAPDRAAERQAVEDFGRGGPEAMRWIRQMLDTQGESYLALEESGTWIGQAGWAEAERDVEAGLRAAETGGATAQLRQLADKHRARLHDLGDYGRYPEVPGKLREEEIVRTERFVQRVETAIRSHGGEVVPDGPNKAVLEEIRQRQEQVDEAYEQVRESMDAHGVGMPGTHLPWQTLGRQDWILFSMDGPAAAEYAAAESSLSSGEEARRRAGDLLTAAAEARSDPLAPQDIGSTYQDALAALDRALTHFQDALSWLDWITETYPHHMGGLR